MKTIQLPELSIIIIPTVFLLVLIFRWELKVWDGLKVSARILLQLLLVFFYQLRIRNHTTRGHYDNGHNNARSFCLDSPKVVGVTRS